MANVSGIAIVIKAFLPTGKTLDEQFAALSIVKAAHETGDYSALLKAANVDSVLTEQKTRRIEDQPQTQQEQQQTTETQGETTGQTASEAGDQQPASETATQAGAEADAKPDADADVPEFLKKDKKSKAA